MKPILWLAVFLILIVIETFTLGLTTIWVAFASLPVALASALGAPIWLQVALLIVISILLFAFMRPIVLQHFNNRRTQINAGLVIGRHAVVTKTINNLYGTGEIKVDGMPWTARAASDSAVICKGSAVEIVEVRGVKAICRPVEIIWEGEQE